MFPERIMLFLLLVMVVAIFLPLITRRYKPLFLIGTGILVFMLIDAFQVFQTTGNKTAMENLLMGPFALTGLILMYFSPDAWRRPV